MKMGTGSRVSLDSDVSVLPLIDFLKFSRSSARGTNEDESQTVRTFGLGPHTTDKAKSPVPMGSLSLQVRVSLTVAPQ